MKTSLKLMPIGILILFTVLLYPSCKKGEQNQKAPSKERQVFKDVQELFNTLDLIEKMNNTELLQWEKEHQHNSFRTYASSWDDKHIITKNEESLLALPTSYQVLLNQEGELQVGDTVVWYNRGKKYYVGADDESKLKNIKLDPTLAKRTGEYTVSALAKYGAPQPETVNLGLTGLNATYQREFNQICPPAGGCRKWVHEIVGVVDNWANFNDPGCGSISSFYVRLLLRIKMEWKNCSRSNWQPAGEARTVSYNLSKNIRLRGVYPPCSTLEANIPFTGTQSSNAFTTTSNVDVVLGAYAGNSRPSTIYWEVNLSGTIYQHVNCDDPNNAWNHVGQPFF